MCFIAVTLLAKVSTVGVHKSLMFQGQFCLFLTEILENSCNCENISLIYHRMDDWKNKVLSSFVIKGRFQWWLDYHCFSEVESQNQWYDHWTQFSVLFHVPYSFALSALFQYHVPKHPYLWTVTGLWFCYCIKNQLFPESYK